MNLFFALSTADPPRVRVVHVITGLNTGGAERMLWKLLAHADLATFDMHVLCLRGEGSVGEEIRALGIPVTCLDIQSPMGVFKASSKLRRYLREVSPDILQGWMYHGNLAAWFGRLLMSSKIPLIWGVRQSLYKLRWEKPSTATVIIFSALISRSASKILYNSHSARGHHERLGYSPERGESIPNGFEIKSDFSNEEARANIRRELGVQEETPLVGMVARFDPKKGHSNFLAAAKLIADRHANVQFVLIGRGIGGDSPMFQQAGALSPLSGRIHLLGERKDALALAAGLDVSVTPSISEGFANAIGEAMSCGIPCVVTDVGDSARVLGGCGRVVPPNDSLKLAQAIFELLLLPVEARLSLGLQARRRINDEYSISVVAGRYQALYMSLVRGRRAG